MRFWFEHSGEVSLREQVVTQVTLGILSGDLAPNERLPSIRELARRFGLHPNTVSAGYRQLESEQWVQSRRGSGVYVRPAPPPKTTPPDALARMLRSLFAGAGRLGLTHQEVIAAVAAWPAAQQAPTRILLVEPDPELARIVLAELYESLSPHHTPSVATCAPTHLPAAVPPGTLLVVLPSKAAALRAATSAPVMTLPIRSIPASLAQHLPSQRDGMLVGIASRWPDFLRFAHTMLVATGFAPEALVVRDAAQPDWHYGLEATAAVLCDLPTATELAQHLPRANAILFRILAEGAAAGLLTQGRLPQSSTTDRG